MFEPSGFDCISLKTPFIRNATQYLNILCCKGGILQCTRRIECRLHFAAKKFFTMCKTGIKCQLHYSKLRVIIFSEPKRYFENIIICIFMIISHSNKHSFILKDSFLRLTHSLWYAFVELKLSLISKLNFLPGISEIM